MKETFVLTFTEDIPLQQARFSIVLKCGKGACRGGCRPFYLEKPVEITIKEKRAEAILKLDANDFTTNRGETLEVPFKLENIGKIQMTNIKVEIKGNIVSDEIVNFAYLNPGEEVLDRISISIDEKDSRTSFNPIVIARFQDPTGKEGITYENIIINVIEKEKVEDLNTTEANNEVIKEPKAQNPSPFYFFLSLSIVAIIAVILFLIRLFKR
jgi:ribosomal protein L19